jgi:hypothetical protein
MRITDVSNYGFPLAMLSPDLPKNVRFYGQAQSMRVISSVQYEKHPPETIV